ncbi:hypothetical protein RvY_14413-2 [Ramazzottius varieornatus]|uniref:Methionine adenosyltransferase 2 subunit beta n=1 Tax=Ramazzottius varieornatus TaxID=947166 RepID=A0A1D1VWA3_RAMVA|nr:hypothetical protein RvY_14413-2 [Ramazzottius varieornatus]
MESNNKTVVVTGASGLLGRAVLKRFEEAGWKATGLAFSRAHKHPNLVKLDITDQEAVKHFLVSTRPEVIVHCAAEKSPDVVEKQPEEARKLNADATRNLALCAVQVKAFFIYISTDSVFDGKNPPYAEDATTSPLNKYGHSKRDGEVSTINLNAGVVLRIPFLYGPVDELAESSVAILFGQVKAGKPVTISHYDYRRPAHVDDIAGVVLLLAEKKLAGEQIYGIYHWSGPDQMTKYEMALIMADLFKLPKDHIKADPNAPTSGAPRAVDPSLSCERLQKLGAPTPVDFRTGVVPVLQPFLNA